MTTRLRLSTRQRLECFESNGGLCHICGGKISAGELWEVEHVIALEAGGEDVPENRRPAHKRVCHEGKTREDHQIGAKIKRVRARHLGARAPSRNPIPGGRNSPWKRKVNGTVERRT